MKTFRIFQIFFQKFRRTIHIFVLITCVLILLYQSILILSLKIALSQFQQSEQNNKEIHTSNSYSLINPLLSCEFGYLIQGNNIVSNKKLLVDYITQIKKQYHVGEISLYYRQLNNGPTLGINEHDEFAPASLLKVPVMITFYKKAEKDPGLLEKKLQLIVDDKREETTPPGNALDPIKQYTIEYLIERMIIYSDNEALTTLTHQLNEQDFNQTLTDIGIKAPDDPLSYTISVKSYASLFRALYNASYLSPEMSEKALLLLTRSEFPEGLRKHIPSDTPIAHKFGLRKDDETSVKLHDCGIVYVPSDPYLLCVMTSGSEYSSLAASISDLSKKIHDLHIQKKSE